MYCFRREEDLKDLDLLFLGGEPLLVKPRWEGSSKGVFGDSLVRTPQELVGRVRRIWERYSQPALAESFLPGHEFTVGVLGNEHPRIAGMMRISCPSQKEGPFLYTLENKREWEERMLYEGPDTIAPSLREALERSALQAFRVLELRDVSRIDFRLDAAGIPRVIDVNPLPGMSPAYSDLPILCRLSGGTYPELVRAIVEEALKRNGLLTGSGVR
jgi:D-alanine-D-alanine ligase